MLDFNESLSTLLCLLALSVSVAVGLVLADDDVAEAADVTEEASNASNATTPASAIPSVPNNNTALSGGAIAGIAIGSIAGVAAVGEYSANGLWRLGLTKKTKLVERFGW